MVACPKRVRSLVSSARAARSDLSNNYISGTLPQTLSSLTSLIQLLLQENNITGSVDPVKPLTQLMFL